MLAAAGWLSGCAGIVGPRTITLTEEDVAAALARRFPMKERVLEVFEVEVAVPRVRLLPDRGRVATELDLQLGDRLFGHRYAGRLGLDHALRYDEAAHTLSLHDVRVERFDIEGADGALRGRSQMIGALIAERLLDGAVIYRMKPEQAERFDRAGMRAGQPKVTERGIEIRLFPAA